MSGGVILAVFSVLHEKINESGYIPLIWYSVNFDFETCFTLLFLYLFKTSLEKVFFNAASVTFGTTIEVGKVLLPSKRVDWRSVAANFCFSVGLDYEKRFRSHFAKQNK